MRAYAQTKPCFGRARFAGERGADRGAARPACGCERAQRSARRRRAPAGAPDSLVHASCDERRAHTQRLVAVAHRDSAQLTMLSGDSIVSCVETQRERVSGSRRRAQPRALTPRADARVLGCLFADWSLGGLQQVGAVLPCQGACASTAVRVHHVLLDCSFLYERALNAILGAGSKRQWSW
eukprot:6191930-Pleurochrysis_carterae.AAC.4